MKGSGLAGSGRLEGSGPEGAALDAGALDVVSGTAPGAWGGGLAVVVGDIVGAGV